MGSTNLTPNYSLSQFVGTDKPAWLQDYNGDMLKIDTAIKAAKTAADTAQNTADTGNTAISTNTADIAALQTTVGGLNSSVTNIQGSVNTIESLIGNGTPTTTDRTIIGAINEINAYLHLKKVLRVDLSLSQTHKNDLDAIFTSMVNAGLTGYVYGKIVFSSGGMYDMSGSTTNDNLRGTQDVPRADGFQARYSLTISNGVSKFLLFRALSSGNSVEDQSANASGATWADIYIYQ